MLATMKVRGSCEGGSHGVDRMIVIESNRPCRPLFGLATPSNKWVKMSGTSKSPIPKENAAASTKRSRRVKRLYASTRTPDVATLANRNVVTPPRTEFGTVGACQCAGTGTAEVHHVLAKKTPEIFPRTPNRIRKRQQKRPAVRFAQRVIAITPLFCAKIDRGVTVNKAERKPPIPSL